MNKPGDVLHDYATNELYGAGIPEKLISGTAITALNSYSDQLVTYAPYPEQKRYQINGVVRTSEPVLTNMQSIAASAGSSITYDISSGQWATIINKSTASTLDFNDSNILGQIAVTGTSLDSFYNSIEVQFPYAYLKDQQNFIRIDLPENLRNLNETDNMNQITYELVNNVVQASLLGNIELRQSREDISVTFKTDYSKFNAQVGDVFTLTNSVYGWTNKLFRIMRIKKNESDVGELTLEITGIAYNEDVYTVEPISDFIPLIGVGHSLPNLGAIATPVAPTVGSSTISSQPSISITATVPEGVVTEIEYWYAKDTAPTTYTLLGSMRSENSGPFTIGDHPTFKTVLLSTGNYTFRVRAVNASGSSLFSPASATVPYVYIQAPDALRYSTPVTNDQATPLMDNGNALNMGMLAFMLASKLNWGDILNWSVQQISDLFGLDPVLVQDMKDAFASEGGAGDEIWTYVTKTTSTYQVQGVCVEKVTSMTFMRPNNTTVKLMME